MNSELSNTETHYPGAGIVDNFFYNLKPDYYKFEFGSLCTDWPDNLRKWHESGRVRSWASTKRISTSNSQNSPGGLYKAIVDPYEIRVLEIKPGVADEPLRSSLHHCSIEFNEPWAPNQNGPCGFALSIWNLENPIRYTALSYTWGEPAANAQIQCDGYRKPITRSLEIALQHLRQKDRPIVLWVDQICINQDDLKEKQQQIPLMSRIYSQAKNTVVWLGEASSESDSGIQLLQDLNYNLALKYSHIDPSEFEKFGLPAEDCDDWKHIWDILSRKWFTRMWIIQEVALSQDIWVACGSTFIPWSTLDQACTNLETCGISGWLQRKLSCDETGSHHFDNFCNNIFYLKSTETIFSLMVKTWPAQCYNPLDKVYGLLGLCYKDEREREAFKPDYSKDYTTLYHDVIVSHLKHSKHVGSWGLASVLCSVEYHSDRMPSWVPDWTKPPETKSLGYSTSSRSVYNACGRFTAMPNRYTFGIKAGDEKRLWTKGMVYDALVGISQVFTDPDIYHQEPMKKNKDLIAARDFASRAKFAVSDVILFEAFWHTLVGGKDSTGRSKCPPSYAEIFSLLLDESIGGSQSSPSLPG